MTSLKTPAQLRKLAANYGQHYHNTKVMERVAESIQLAAEHGRLHLELPISDEYVELVRTELLKKKFKVDLVDINDDPRYTVYYEATDWDAYNKLPFWRKALCWATGRYPEHIVKEVYQSNGVNLYLISWE